MERAPPARRAMYPVKNPSPGLRHEIQNVTGKILVAIQQYKNEQSKWGALCDDYEIDSVVKVAGVDADFRSIQRGLIPRLL